LDDGQLSQLLSVLKRELGTATLNHAKREKWLAKLLKAYKAQPEFEVKNFPWPGASNVVIPVVAISVDTVAARLQKAVLGAKDPVEAHIGTSSPFVMTIPPDPTALPNSPASMQRQEPIDDKLVRDWAAWFLRESGGRDKLRTVFIDMPLYGDAFVSPLWVEETKIYHAYNASGEVVQQDVPGYEGVKWNDAAAADVVKPTGFDEWDQLPWFALRLRYSKADLADLVEKDVFKQEDVDRLRPKQREDPRRKVEKKAEHVGEDTNEIYELYEVRGKWEIPSTENTKAVWDEVVLTYSLDYNVLMRAIYNPYFGKARHFVKIPFLVQPHEIDGLGVAEMSLPFQEEASTSHNQVIDAATAANAGITVVSTNVNLGPNEEIHPGKTITTDGNPKDDLAIYHLSEPSAALGGVEEKAFFMNEKRTGVSVYNMGMESPTVGSRATATGTTALINEGNQRFWVSIDDMRRAIEELLYLTIQQEQQMRPEGYYFEKGRYIQFPPGDPRQSIGLRLSLTSESVNRDIEVQQMQMLISVLNDYYMRLNQAMMIIVNPQFPPQVKLIATQTMMASAKIMKKFVERFDVENLDEVVPTVLAALQQLAEAMQGQANGPGQMAPSPPSGQGGLPQGPPGRPNPPIQPAQGGFRPQ
jgi:hypothetical protein